MQSEVQCAETTIDDHLRNLIQLMKRGGRVSVTDIPNDPTFLSSHFGGPMAQAMAEKLEAALSAAEPFEAAKALMIGSYVNDAAHNLLVKHTGREGGRPTVDWYKLRNEIALEIEVGIDAFSSQAAPSVSVKALEWQRQAMSHGYGLFIRLAKTSIGDYQISHGAAGKYEVYLNKDPISASYDSVHEAKAVAKADFEARIISALSAQVQDVVGISAADQIIGQIEEIFPNWPKYRDLVDCIICELHELRQRAEGQNNG